jgi:hypothetical protein
MCASYQQPRYFGQSVAGPQHRAEKTSCQDAWRGWSGLAGAAISVADGLGSRPRSALGARLATHAAISAFRMSARSPGVTPDWIARGIEVIWRFRVAPHQPQDCASTCLLAGWTQEDGLTVGGLGDGLALLRTSEGSVRSWFARADGQTLNETDALGHPHQLTNWKLHREKVTGPWAVALMTDGLSDDLRPDRLAELVSWLVDEVAPREPRERRRMLRRSLETWPTPNHTDDKTIAVLFSHA